MHTNYKCMCVVCVSARANEIENNLESNQTGIIIIIIIIFIYSMGKRDFTIQITTERTHNIIDRYRRYIGGNIFRSPFHIFIINAGKSKRHTPVPVVTNLILHLGENARDSILIPKYTIHPYGSRQQAAGINQNNSVCLYTQKMYAYTGMDGTQIHSQHYKTKNHLNRINFPT